MITQEKIETIQRLFLGGLSKTKIAKEVGVSLPTVTKYTKDLPSPDSMIGGKYGKLLVLSRAEKDPALASRCIRYICQCDCGSKIEVNGNSLRTGHTTSCGCARRSVGVKDLTNQQFGLLTAIRYTGESDKERRAIWECQCDCGETILVPSKLLVDKKVLSCGCLKESLGEKKVSELLETLGYNFIKQYRIPECRLIKPLPFDFAIFKENTLVALIEYQGDIHYKATSGWNTEERLKQNQERDRIKKEFCKAHDIPLLIIPYWDYDKLDTEYIKKGVSSGL